MILESVYSGKTESPIQVMQAFLDRLDLKELDLSKINIHKLFYDAKKTGTFFKGFYFNGNSKFPFSQQIEDVLYEMTICGKLTRPNPTMTSYNFVSIDKDSYNNIGKEWQKTVDLLVSNAKTCLGK